MANILANFEAQSNLFLTLAGILTCSVLLLGASKSMQSFLKDFLKFGGEEWMQKMQSSIYGILEKRYRTVSRRDPLRLFTPH